MLIMIKMGVIGRTVKWARVDSEATRQRRVVDVSEHVFSVASLKPIRSKQAL
jgi:hypothetical protein